VSSSPSELDSLRSLDPKTVGQVHDRFFPELYRYAQFRINDPAIAEDLASETFLRLIEAIRAGRGPERHLRGWLFATTRHLIDEHFRRHFARPQGPLSEQVPLPDHGPEQISEEEDSQRALRAAMSRLTPDQQQVLALRFLTGCSLTEAAEMLGKKPNAIKALQFRALTALRRALEDSR
jgi:RNA polymerase sigma-70 factor (ECF subfamily)